MSNPIFDHLRRVSSAFQESSVLAAAAELDVFTEILKQENRVTATDLAEAMSVDLRGLTVLLDVLTSCEYLVKGYNTVDNTGDASDATAVYTVTDRYKTLLDSRTPETFVPMLRHMAHVQRNWTQLAFAVKTGKPSVPQGSFLGPEQDNVSFIWAMNSIARTLVEPTVESLKQAGVLAFDKEKIRFIDIGGASGTYTQAFLEAVPNSEGTLFDLPAGVAAARKRFSGSPFENRVTLVEGDFTRDELPTGHDFAWISAIIHQMSRQESRQLYGKAFRALESGAKIAVRDFMMNSNRTAPKDGAFFGINMLANTETGMVYKYDEVREDLETAGFVDVTFAVPTETMSAVVTAKKP